MTVEFMIAESEVIERREAGGKDSVLTEELSKTVSWNIYQ
jgi:hypothetical protein